MKITWKNIIYVVSIIALVYMTFNMIYAASFSVLVGDDFWHGVEVGEFHVPFGEYIFASFAYAKKVYLEWQGTFFSMFIQALLSPINNFGFRQLRIIMASNAALFFGSLILFIIVSLRGIDKEYNYLKALIIAIMVFAICGYEVYPEIFFWFSGATSYSIPLSLLLLASVLFILIEEKGKIIYAIGSGMLGLLAMGGSLTVSGTGVYFAVLVCAYMFMTKRKINIAILSVSVLWIIGAVFNAAAPGNYVRHADADQTGIHPLEALENALDMASIRWQFFFENTNFVFLLFVIVLIGFYISINSSYNKQDDFKAKIIIAVLGLFTPVVTSFPLALGYSSDMIPNRCAFLIDFSIIISAVHISFISGVLIAKHISVGQRNIIMIFMGMLLAMAFMLDGYGYQNIKIKEVSEQLCSGEYKEHYYECKDFILGLEMYEKDTDIRINKNSFPSEMDNIQNFYLSMDPEHLINRSVAEYYGFNSIATYEE